MRERVNTVRITRERNDVLVKNTRQDRVRTQSPVANEENENMEIMTDYESRKTVTLKELLPNWWGKAYANK